MDPISLIVLVVVVGGASIILDRKWRTRQLGGDARATFTSAKEGVASFLSQTSSRAQALGSQAAGQTQSWRERMPFGKPQPSLAADFRGWVAQASAGEADLRDWLAGLSDDQFADFTDNVAGFCASAGFELEWLVREEFSRMPQLAENSGQVVVNYCRACLQAAIAQAGLNSFRAYREYTEKPDSRKGWAYGEKLLDRLLEAGLTTVSLSDFLGAAPKAKQEQVLQAIQSAAEKDPAAFNRVLKAMASGEGASKAQEEAVPAAAAA